jgi:hypothetical protein
MLSKLRALVSKLLWHTLIASAVAYLALVVTPLTQQYGLRWKKS